MDDNSTDATNRHATKGRARVYSIDYPSLVAGADAAEHELNQRGSANASLAAASVLNGLVVLERKGGQVIFLYANGGARELTATAILNRNRAGQ